MVVAAVPQGSSPLVTAYQGFPWVPAEFPAVSVLFATGREPGTIAAPRWDRRAVIRAPQRCCCEMAILSARPGKLRRHCV